MRFRKMPPGQVAAYAPAEKGPFHCGNCEYQTDLLCVKPEVLREMVLLGNIPEGSKTAKVDAGGCCSYQETR